MPNFKTFLFLSFFCSFLSFGQQIQQSNTLKVGESIVLSVNPKKRTNLANIMVEKGQRYKITAKGQWQDATFPPTDANGFVGFTLPMKVGNNLKVLPEENYMMLLAQVGKIYTPIGVEREFTPQNSGELNFLTNDARFFFGSNHGDIEVTVERLD